MQRSIYVPKDRWEEVKAEAKRNGQTITAYLLWAHDRVKGTKIKLNPVPTTPQPVDAVAKKAKESRRIGRGRDGRSIVEIMKEEKDDD